MNWTFFASACVMGIPLGVFFGFLRSVIQESRNWRHLVQLYYEARLHKQLPVDLKPDDEPVSSITLPKDVLADLERQDAERERWL